MALARKRKEEQARMERLRLEEEAKVAMEKVKVVDQELGVGITMEELQASIPVLPNSMLTVIAHNQLLKTK